MRSKLCSAASAVLPCCREQLPELDHLSKPLAPSTSHSLPRFCTERVLEAFAAAISGIKLDLLDCACRSPSPAVPSSLPCSPLHSYLSCAPNARAQPAQTVPCRFSTRPHRRLPRSRRRRRRPTLQPHLLQSSCLPPAATLAPHLHYTQPQRLNLQQHNPQDALVWHPYGFSHSMAQVRHMLSAHQDLRVEARKVKKRVCTV